MEVLPWFLFRIFFNLYFVHFKLCIGILRYHQRNSDTHNNKFAVDESEGDYVASLAWTIEKEIKKETDASENKLFSFW